MQLKLVKSAFTIDVEDGISLAMRDAFSRKTEQTDRVVTLTQRVLDLLSQYDTKATFFVLGQVAEKFPGLVRRIADEGHELGVHGYNHYQFFKMSRKQAFAEITRAKKLLEDLSGSQVLGHRAPAFSITPETEWALEVIAEAGFLYDSSIMPIKGIRYGWPGFPKNIHTLQTSNGKNLVEVPLSSVSILGTEMPVCGGGYLRLFPYWLTRKAFEKVLKHRPVILYIHPYELDTKRYPNYYFKQMEKGGLLKKYKMKSMWLNRKSMVPKLSRLLQNYEFDRMISLVEKYKAETGTKHAVS